MTEKEEEEPEERGPAADRLENPRCAKEKPADLRAVCLSQKGTFVFFLADCSRAWRCAVLLCCLTAARLAPKQSTTSVSKTTRSRGHLAKGDNSPHCAPVDECAFWSVLWPLRSILYGRHWLRHGRSVSPCLVEGGGHATACKTQGEKRLRTDATKRIACAAAAATRWQRREARAPLGGEGGF